jgi:hypothetical protein
MTRSAPAGWRRRSASEIRRGTSLRGSWDEARRRSHENGGGLGGGCGRAGRGGGGGAATTAVNPKPSGAGAGVWADGSAQTVCLECNSSVVYI